MRGSTKDLPTAFEAEGVRSQQAEWGEMNVALEHVPAGLDTAPLFKGLPDDRCQCPYSHELRNEVVKGSNRAKK